MPRTAAPFEVNPAFGPTTKAAARDLYEQCRRNGYLYESELVDLDEWPRLVGALRRLAAADGLSVSQHTQRERSFPHRPTRQVQVHKDGMLAFLS